MHLKRLFLMAVLSTIVLSLSLAVDAEEKKEIQNPMVSVKTNMGSFTIELLEKEAPITVDNFLNYVDMKFYDGTIFHRVMPRFVIQGGGFTPDMMKKETGPPIKNEATNGLKNEKGTLSMARTNVINSATCQFFINVVDNPDLDHKDETARGYGYAVFGKVVDGWDTIEKIRRVETTTKNVYRDVPVKPVVIESMRRIETEEKQPQKKSAEKEQEKE